MALPTDLTLGGLTFTLLPPKGNDGRIYRISTASSAMVPHMLVFQHTQAAIKGTKVMLDRHVAQVQQVVLDSSGNPWQRNIQLVVGTPRLAIFEDEDTQVEASRLASFINHAPFFNPFLRGEA